MGLVVVMLMAFLLAAVAMSVLAYLVLSEIGPITMFYEDGAAAAA
jgi:hypothetical protein